MQTGVKYQGGLSTMLDRIRRERGCSHEQRIVTRNHGIERQVCERCGHVSVRLIDQRAEADDLIGTMHQHR